MRQWLLVLSLAVAVVGCASHPLVPREQAEAIKDRDRALAPHSAAIQDTIRQSGNEGALAFLDAGDDHLVVLPGDTPADAWARYIASPSGSPTGRVSVPPVVSFVHRADVPKAPDSVTSRSLEQQETLRATLAALDTELRKLSDSVVATRRDTQTSIATAREDMQKTLDSLAGDLASDRAAGIVESRDERREREWLTEGRGGEPGSERKFSQAGRHHAPAIGQSRQPAQRACGPARCDTGEDQ